MHAHAAVILLTPRAVESARVQNEINTFLARAKGDTSFRILLVLLEACDVPASLGSLPIITVLGRPPDWLAKKLARSIPRQAKPSEAHPRFSRRPDSHSQPPSKDGYADRSRPKRYPLFSDKRRSAFYKAPSKGPVQHDEDLTFLE